VTTHKLSRKELKHDSFMDWIAHSTEWLQQNYVKVAVGLLVLIAAIVGIRMALAAQVKARHRAMQEMFAAESLLLRGDFAGARDRLAEIRDRFGDSALGRQAAQDLVQAQLALGQNDAALATLDQTLAKVPQNDPLRRALLGLKANALDALRRPDDSHAIYRDLLASRDLTPQERYATTMAFAGSLERAQKLQEAIDLLTRLQAAVNTGELKVTDRAHEAKLRLLQALAG